MSSNSAENSPSVVSPSSADPYRSPGSDSPSNMPANAKLIHTDHGFAQRSNTVEDYSRIMLEYTSRRMAGFADPARRGYASSRSSRSSNASGQSGTSISGSLAGQAAGPGPTKLQRSSTTEEADESTSSAPV